MRVVSRVVKVTTSSEFTVVLYISNDFVGRGTHYLSGRHSEVKQLVELRPNLGCASVHRQGTVVHAGGAVTSGTKYIMQFFLFYDSPEVAEPREVLNLGWGVLEELVFMLHLNSKKKHSRRSNY